MLKLYYKRNLAKQCTGLYAENFSNKRVPLFLFTWGPKTLINEKWLALTPKTCLPTPPPPKKSGNKHVQNTKSCTKTFFLSLTKELDKKKKRHVKS